MVTRVGESAALTSVQPAYTVNVPLSGYQEVRRFPVPTRGGISGNSAIQVFRRVAR